MPFSPEFWMRLPRMTGVEVMRSIASPPEPSKPSLWGGRRQAGGVGIGAKEARVAQGDLRVEGVEGVVAAQIVLEYRVLHHDTARAVHVHHAAVLDPVDQRAAAPLARHAPEKTA